MWHGCAFRALQQLEQLSWDIDCFDESESRKKPAIKLEEALAYFGKNKGFIVNYGDRYHHGDPISTGFVESAVNQIVSKRFVKKQQMAWTDQNAHDLLQVRTTVLNDELRDKFEQWYPSMAANDVTTAQAAYPPVWRGLQFRPDDLSTWKREMSDLNGIGFAGVGG